MNNKSMHKLIPWYVNGSLIVDERAEVKQSLASSDELKRDQQFLSKLRQQVQNKPSASPGDFGWHRLRRDINNQAKAKSSTKWRTFSIAISLLLMVQLCVMLNYSQEGDRFVPLSDSKYADNIIQIQFNEIATVNDINRFLLEMDASIIDGPSKKGIYHIRLHIVNDKKLKEISKQKNLVDFVAEE